MIDREMFHPDLLPTHSWSDHSYTEQIEGIKKSLVTLHELLHRKLFWPLVLEIKTKCDLKRRNRLKHPKSRALRKRRK